MADANKTIDDLNEEELEGLIEAGRLSDDGDILPAENDEAGSDDDQDIKGSDEGEQGEDDAETEGDPGEDEGTDKTKSEADPEKADVAAEADDTDPDKADTDDGTKDVMIPKARLDQETGRRRQLEEEIEEARRKLAFFEGRESVRAEAVKPASEADPKKDQKTVDTLETEIDQIWEQAEVGDLTMSQARKLEREKQAEIDQLKQSESNANRKAPEQQTDYAKSVVEREINRAAQKVVDEHPYLGELSPTDVAYLGSKLDDQIKSQGIRVPRDPIDLQIWRMEQIGLLADKFGPGLTGKTLTPKTDPDPTPEQKQQTAKAKAADRQAKLKVAQQQPPSSTATGAAEGGVGEYTDEQIANMSETELEKLPQSVLDRLAN
ncbi:hypothetical protein [Thalassospira aquimaris]|uniref:Scaffolding protein n=1 Tax=Thalassospira aquimaris TaxID=3037796 RepID=A0ABT6GGF0_9PROT|nr:hypothetical protein [Thalassospira sp. FZY0004]MDG4721160.1 hypothetical protein [Thalassospira sp. FZY0004]